MLNDFLERIDLFQRMVVFLQLAVIQTGLKTKVYLFIKRGRNIA